MPSGKSIKWLAALVVGFNLVIVAVVLLGGPTKTTRPPLPNPNGYDDFLKAARLLTWKPVDYDHLSSDQLRALVMDNVEALVLFRAGLGLECRVPIDYYKTNLNSRFDAISGFRLLALLAMYEGKLAELENRTNDAAKIYLDVIRFSHESSRGGLVADSAIGQGSENAGLAHLLDLNHLLDAKECREISQGLEAVDLKSESLQQVMEQEKTYLGFSGGIYKLLNFKMARPLDQMFATHFHDREMRRRQAMITFAARAYELENGKPPASSADLVPAYLKAVPPDPFTGKNMIYTPGDSPR
jgi:hypothetical protein